MINAPQQQIPGVYHRRVGDIVVTAISDGFLDGTLEVLRNISQDEARQILTDCFRPARRTAVNAFLIHSAGRLALIETGSGNYLQPTAGKVLTNIKAAGVAPTDIEAVLLTHMHPDHSAGLTDMATGKPNYPNAELVMHQREPEHTPGHTTFMISSGKEQLLIWGDTVHVPEVQTARPEVCMDFDTDQDMAAASRRKVFDMAATDRLLVTGMHLHFPGFAHLVRNGTGYRLIPAAWEQAL